MLKMCFLSSTTLITTGFISTSMTQLLPLPCTNVLTRLLTEMVIRYVPTFYFLSYFTGALNTKFFFYVLYVFPQSFLILLKVEVHVNPSAPPSYLLSDLKPEQLEPLKVN